MAGTGASGTGLWRLMTGLPLALLALAIATFWAIEPPAAHESPFLLTALNVTFSSLVGLFVAYLCARSFLATAELGVLLLGCGVLVWGVSSGVAALGIGRGGNFTVTVHNVGVWVFGACSLAGAALAGRAWGVARAPGPWVAGVYSAGLAAVVLVTGATLEAWTPVFFVQGLGGTLVRQIVLGSAVVMFVVTAVLLWRLNRRVPSAFLRWYASGLALLSVGLAGIWLQEMVGSLLGWASRAAQYLGGVYLAVAGASTLREARGWRISLAAALRASQERYAAFAAATFEGIVESDAGRIVACNEQFAQMVGRSTGDLAGMAFADLVVPADRERVMTDLAMNVESVIEHGLLSQDGTRIEVEARGRPARPGRGHRYTAVRDITERKQAQERVARFTTLYAVLSQVNEAIVRIHDRDDLYREVCRIVAEEAQFDLVWVGEVDDGRVIPRASSGPAVSYLEEIRIDVDGPFGQGPTGRAIREGEPVINESFALDPSMSPWRDAAMRHGLRTSAAFPLRSHGETIGALTLYASALDTFDAEEVRLLGALAADLSYALDAMSQERLRAETVEQLRQSEEARKVSEAVRTERQRLFDVLETLPAMICLLTPDYHVAFANRGFRNRFGESGGRRCFEYCYSRAEPCEFCESHGVLRIGQTHRWEVCAPDGAVLSVFASPFTDADGSPMILEMILDITEPRRAERELREVHEHLADRAGQLRALARELTVSAQRERRRLAGVLHDHMQQLLIAAKYRTAALAQARDTATRQTAAEIERLLDMSIAEGRALTAELSPPTLRAGGLPTDLEWLARRMAARHGLTVEMSLDDDLPPIAEDVRILLFESVRELLFNAVKHAQVQSLEVTVRRTPGGQIRITVTDEGKGFDPSRLTKTGETGGGFGLISIQERLDLLGGSMEIDAAPGRGSRFTLTIQAGSEPAPEEGAAPASLPARPSRVRVLLADDHAVVREGLRRLLTHEGDIEVIGEATDGKEAVDLAAALRPDVILMDLSMPRVNGVEATRAIHRDQPDIRIIGLSMFDDGSHAEDMRAAGAVDYLTKSGPPDRLLASIRHVRPSVQ